MLLSSHGSLCQQLAFVVAFTGLCTATAEAQIVSRLAGGGVQIHAPSVGINVGPGGAPALAIGRNGRGLISRLRARFARPPQSAPPAQNPPNQPERDRESRSAQRPQRSQEKPEQAQRAQHLAPSAEDNKQMVYQAIETIALPTSAELAAMGDLDLQTTLWDFSHRLNQRLTRLKTGGGWQRHLGLPAAGIGTDEAAQIGLRDTLSRFNSVLENPEYEKIYNLSSFAATHAVLNELVGRLETPKESTALAGLEGPQIIEPSSGKTASWQTKSVRGPELLPTPAAASKPDPPQGERSILRRK